MLLFEITIALLMTGALLAALARKVGAPYPAFVAIAGAGLALLPGMPTLSLSPDLILTLFVAPVLVDSAYDASPRDLRDNWLPIAGNAVVSVIVTVAAVALAARWLRPDIPWAAAIVLGAIVAPPDASAATAVLRALRPPHRIMVILEGESLLNDATALLIYRVGVAAAAGAWGGWAEVPGLFAAIAGGIAFGMAMGWVVPRLMERISDIPTAVMFQFITTFAMWIAATWLALSPIITLLCFAMTLARSSPRRTDARLRIQSYAVWDVAIFVLNVLAFILAGLQLGPILADLHGFDRVYQLGFAGSVLAVVVLIRIAWVMGANGVYRWKVQHFGARTRRRLPPPTMGTGLVISWCGMRGVVTLATALALPEDFPHRGLILAAAFMVVLGTLVAQGLTLRPLMAMLALPEDDQVEREVRLARARAAEAALEALGEREGHVFAALRTEYDRRRAETEDEMLDEEEQAHRRTILARERLTIRELRASGEIGDDAFNLIEEEIDWAEMYVVRRIIQPGD